MPPFPTPLLAPPAWATASVESASNAAATPLLAARSDEQAVAIWLAEYADRPRTWTAYRKEAERFLLWLRELGLKLGTVKREDVLAYRAFLAAPPAHWTGPSRPRTHPDWRPLTGPLSAASQHQAQTILAGLYSYLNHAGFVSGNPFRLLRQKTPPTQHTQERFLSETAWQAVLECVATLPRETAREQAHAERALWLISLLYLTGARRSEVAGARMGDLFERKGLWWWAVQGKGGKIARIPCSEELMAACRRYRQSLGLPAQPAPGENTPLLAQIPLRKAGPLLPLGDKGIYLVVRELFRRAAQRTDDPGICQQLKQATTHWLRHTAATHQLEAGVPLIVVSQNLRHSNLQTTRRYLHTEDEARHAASGVHSLRSRASDTDKEKPGD
ncbi:Site-specific recombinase XerD [Gulbenkiania indica]|uniref:Site-specific recombinase XerD n=1 Tax=Gulbenkiania indica TaxID=375574 RepID=A0A0K6H0Z0_9NEIS|nr:site-specific integrase [Gulbenkiania indica]CUA84637.1 Site-specific recombinase XerD [Gulbenkiania indica]